MSASQSKPAQANVDVPCPNCGEMVRKGSVRCRECGAFLDPNVERIAREEMPTFQEETNDADFDLSENLDAGGDDFEVAPGVTTFEAGESAFELSIDALAGSSDEELEQFALAEDPLADDGAGVAVGAPPAADVKEPPPGDEIPADETAEESKPAPSAEFPGGSTGDVLLDSALAEEAEAEQRQRGRIVKVTNLVPGQGVIVFCPSGHRIHVADKFRGRTGRCPQCRAPFVVPGTPPAGAFDEPEEKSTEQQPEDDSDAVLVETQTTGRFELWMPDVLLHRVALSKLRLKEGSLADETETVDLGFAEDGLLVVTVFKGKGGLTSRAAMKKKAAVREEVHFALEESRKKADPGELPAPFSHYIKQADFDKIWIAQPAPPRGESLFAELDLFGPGAIGIRLPGVEGDTERLYITPSLSQYRELVRVLAEKYDIVLPSEEHGIPMTDQFDELSCHYSSQTLKVLRNVEFYQRDPRIELELVGRQCGTCGIAVSEASRAQEKLGGKNGSGIAKAKCPSCTQKFGDKSLYAIKADESSDD